MSKISSKRKVPSFKKFYFSLSLSLSIYRYRYTHTHILYTQAQTQTHTHTYICVCAQLLSCVQFFTIPWTVANQTLLSMKFSRQEYWSGLPGDLPNPGIEPECSASPALACRFFTLEPSGKPTYIFWSGVSFPTPGDCPSPEIKPASLVSPALAGRFFTARAT